MFLKKKKGVYDTENGTTSNLEGCNSKDMYVCGKDMGDVHFWTNCMNIGTLYVQTPFLQYLKCDLEIDLTEFNVDSNSISGETV